MAAMASRLALIPATVALICESMGRMAIKINSKTAAATAPAVSRILLCKKVALLILRFIDFLRQKIKPITPADVLRALQIGQWKIHVFEIGRIHEPGAQGQN